MNAKNSALLALVALAAAPLATHAQDSAQAAVDACVKSFIESYLPDRTVKQVRGKAAPPMSPIEAHYAPRQYTVALSAYGARTGDLLAQAQCVASRDGSVIVLDDTASRERLAHADFAVSLR
jgi:hypothetical protein